MLRNTCLGGALMAKELLNMPCPKSPLEELLPKTFYRELSLGEPHSRKAYLEGSWNKFIDEVHEIPSTYGACDARKDGWHVTAEHIP